MKSMQKDDQKRQESTEEVERSTTQVSMRYPYYSFKNRIKVEYSKETKDSEEIREGMKHLFSFVDHLPSSLERQFLLLYSRVLRDIIILKDMDSKHDCLPLRHSFMLFIQQPNKNGLHRP